MFDDPTPRSAFISFRVTPDEREFVQAAAASAGMSTGRLIRQALAKATRRSDRDEETVTA
jgi:uncharacterized protein (DUF1778 family)